MSKLQEHMCTVQGTDRTKIIRRLVNDMADLKPVNIPSEMKVLTPFDYHQVLYDDYGSNIDIKYLVVMKDGFVLLYDQDESLYGQVQTLDKAASHITILTVTTTFDGTS